MVYFHDWHVYILYIDTNCQSSYIYMNMNSMEWLAYYLPINILFSCVYNDWRVYTYFVYRNCQSSYIYMNMNSIGWLAYVYIYEYFVCQASCTCMNTYSRWLAFKILQVEFFYAYKNIICDNM